jgi:pimeloyl-ACP methyl ester carboxylesterase
VALTVADREALHTRLPRARDVSFITEDGLVIRGSYVPSRNGVAVVVGHGFMSNRMQLAPDVEMLARHGYGCLFFDWRGQGESDGDTVSWGDGEQKDLAAAVEFALQQPDVTGGQVAGLGFSAGASALAVEAARDPRLRAVILEAVWTSLEDEMKDKVHRFYGVSFWPARLGMSVAGVHFDNVRPIDRVAEIHPRPLLMIGGTVDFDTPVTVVKRTYAAAGEPKRLWIADGASHGGYIGVVPVEYERVVTGFLDEAFLGQRRP